VGGPAGSPGSGQGGTVATTGKGGSTVQGHGGSTGVAGTTEVTGKGGATVSGQGGTTGTAGAPGHGGATATTGRGGTTATTGRGGSTGTAGTTGAAGSTTPPVDAGIPGSGCTAPAAYANLFVTVSGHTQADSDAKVAAAWSKLFTAGASGAIFFNGPGSDESYVEDTYNNDVRTEGMSYGMMIAVQLDHQTEFDRLWQFVKKHMAQGTGQIAWHVSTSGSKLATGGAPDGDEYFATALIFAHNRWGDTSGKFNYGMEAQWILDMMRTMEFSKTAHLVEFVAGSNNTDGSYVLPAFYQVWACFDTANADFWNQAVDAGRMFFHSAIDSNGVIGDRSSFTGQSQAGPGSDTIRCVANIMMDHYLYNADPWQTDTYATKYGAYEMTHANGVAQQSCNSLLGFGLPASTGKAFVDKLWSTNPPNRDYWNGVLYMLAMVHVSGNFHIW
jgi:oligosaccharide reducing-end xylanase